MYNQHKQLDKDNMLYSDSKLWPFQHVPTIQTNRFVDFQKNLNFCNEI